MVRDKVEESEWKCLDVNEHWQEMKTTITDTVQDIMSNGPRRHKQTW